MASDNYTSRTREINRSFTEIDRLLSVDRLHDDVWDRVVELLQSIVSFDQVLVLGIDQKRGTAIEVCSQGVGSETVFGTRSLQDVGISESLADLDKPLITSISEMRTLDSKFDVDIGSLNLNLRSRLIVPIKRRGEIVGTLVLRSCGEDAFSLDDGDYVTEVAALMAGPLVSWSSHRNVMQETVERTALSEIARSADAATSIDELGDAVAKQVRELIDCKYVAINILEETNELFRVSYVSSDRQIPGLEVGDSREFKGSLFGVVSGRKRPVSIGSGNFDDWIERAPQLKRSRDAGIARAIIANMFSGEKLVGTIGIGDFDGPEYLATEANLLQQIADQVAPVIDNLQLNDDLERQLKQSRLLTRISSELHSEVDQTVFFESLVKDLEELIEFDRFAIGSDDPSISNYVSGMPIDPKKIDRVATRERFTWTDDDDRSVIDVLEEDSVYRADEVAYEAGIRSRLRAFLGSPGDSLGHIVLGSARSNAFTTKDAELLSQISLLMSPVLLSIREQAAVERLAAERQALADVGGLINSSDGLSDALPAVYSRLDRLAPLEALHVAVLDQESGLYVDHFVENLQGNIQLTSSEPFEALENIVVGKIERTSSVVRTDSDITPKAIGARMVSGAVSVGAIYLCPQSELDSRLLSDSLLTGLSAQFAGALSLENVNNRLKYELQEQSALTEVSRLFASEVRLTDVFDSVGEILATLVPCDHTFIVRIQLDDEHALVTHRWARSGKKLDTGFTYRIQGSQMELLLNSRLVHHIGEHNFDSYLAQLSRMRENVADEPRSQISAPLIVRDEVIGMFGIRSYEKDAFSTRHVQLVSNLSSLLASELDKERLRDELQSSAAQDRALAEISRAVSEDLELDHLYSRLGDALADVVPFDRLAIATIGEDDDGNLVDTVAYARGVPIDGYKPGDSMSSHDNDEPALQGSLTLGINEVKVYPISEGTLLSEILMPLGLKSRLRALVGLGEERLAIISILSKTADAYGEGHIEFLSRVCEQVAPAIQNANRHRRTLELVSIQETLAEINRSVTHNLNLQDIYKDLADAIAKTVPSDRMTISTWGPEWSTIEFVQGEPVEGLGVGARFSTERYLKAQNNDRSLLLTNADDVFIKRFMEMGYRTRIQILIGPDERPEGVLALVRSTEEGFSRSEERLLKQMANEIAPAFANASEHQSVIRLAAEQNALAEVSTAVNQDLDLDRVYERLSEAIKDLITYDRMVFSLIESSEQGVYNQSVVYVDGVRVPGLEPGIETPSWIARYREELGTKYGSVNQTINSPIHPNSPLLNDALPVKFQSRVSTLVGFNDAPIGVLSLLSAEENAYDSNQLRLLDRMAELIAPAIVNARQFEESQKLSSERELIAEIGRAVTSSLQTDSIFETLESSLSGVLDFDELVISTIDERNRILTDIFASHGAFESNALQQMRLDGTLTENILGNQKPLVVNVNDPKGIVKEFPAIERGINRGIRSYCISPLISRGQTVGTIVLRSKIVDCYSQESGELLQSIADQIAPAIVAAENSRTRETLARIGAEISENLDIDELYKRLAEVLDEAVPHDRMTISKWGPENSVIEFVSGQELPEFRVGTVFDTTPYRDISNNGKSSSLLETPEILAAAGFGSRIFVLIGPLDKPMAILAITRRSSIGFTTSEENLLRQIANQITPVVANAIEHEEVRRLRDSYEQAQLALDSTSDMVAILDADLRYIYVNDSWLRNSGYGREEIIGRRPPIQDADVEDGMVQEYLETLRHGEYWSGSFKTRRKDGTEYQEQSNTTPVRDEHGNVTNFIVIKRDVTELLETEAMISQAATRQDLVATVEHEIRSPLAAVVNYVDLLRRSEDGNPRVVERLKSSTTELVSTVNELRAIVSGTETQRQLDTSMVDIVQLARDAAESQTFLAEKKRLRIRVDTLNIPERAEIELDEAKFRQVLTNLVGNAVRYSPAESRVEIRLDQNERFTRIRIYNEGVGVDETDLTRVTQLYYRGESSQNSSEVGSGIGLAFSDAIIKALGGHMLVRSEPDEFFEVEILLPNPGSVETSDSH